MKPFNFELVLLDDIGVFSLYKPLGPGGKSIILSTIQVNMNFNIIIITSFHICSGMMTCITTDTWDWLPNRKIWWMSLFPNKSINTSHYHLGFPTHKPYFRFAESCWRCLLYALFFLYGAYILTDKPWFWQPRLCWPNWSRQEITTDIWWWVSQSFSVRLTKLTFHPCNV